MAGRIDWSKHALDGTLVGALGLAMVWERETSEDGRFVP